MRCSCLCSVISDLPSPSAPASDDAYPVAPPTTELSALSASHQLMRIVIITAEHQTRRHPHRRIGTEARNNADGKQERRKRPLCKPYWLRSFNPFWLIADASWRLGLQGGMARSQGSPSSMLAHPIGLTPLELVQGARWTPLAH